MPILGLFPTSQEQRYARDVGGIASGQRSSLAVQDIQRNAETARKEAFAQAYQSRGNPALARRQAMDVSRDVTMQSGQQMARQRAADVEAAKAEQQRLEQQRVAGINNLIGFGVRGAGMLAASPAATVAQPIVGGIQQALQPQKSPPPKPTMQQPAQAAYNPLTGAGMGPPVSNEDIMSLAGPRQPAAPMRQDLQQYLDPNVVLESGSRLGTDLSSLSGLQEQLTPEYLTRGLDPRFMRGVRNYARR